MILLSGHDQIVADWVARKFGAFVRHPYVALGCLDKSGVLRGAFIITPTTDTTAELHVYGKTSNDTVRGMFQCVFNVLGVYRLEARVSKRNKITKKATPKFGFAFEGVARDFYGPGEDALLFAMRPHQCRWIKDDHGLSVRRV